MASIALVVSALVSSCSGPGWLVGAKKTPTSDAITIAASFYPIAEIVERVGGDKVNVVNLTPPGVDAHDVELTAKQLQELQDAKVSFYLGKKFQPTIWKAISALPNPSIDLLASTPTFGFTCGGCEGDPHVWLDPANMILMTNQVMKSLNEAQPEMKKYFSDRAASFVSELKSVGVAIDTHLASCTSPVLVTSHYSFSYFARRANIALRSLAPLNPDGQLSAQELETTVAELKSKKVTTIFSEELVTNSLVQQVAQQLGATTNSLQPLEGMTNADIKAGKNYVNVQMENIARIAKGLRCS